MTYSTRSRRRSTSEVVVAGDRHLRSVPTLSPDQVLAVVIYPDERSPMFATEDRDVALVYRKWFDDGVEHGTCVVARIPVDRRDGHYIYADFDDSDAAPENHAANRLVRLLDCRDPDDDVLVLRGVVALMV